MAKFDFEENRVLSEIRGRGAKRVLIQLPEGLKREGPRLAAVVEKVGVDPIVSADPCYGACDLATRDAKRLDVDLIIHYGHSGMMKQEGVETLFFEARSGAGVKAAMNAAIQMLDGYSHVGITTTVQHIHRLDEVRELLLASGKRVEIGNADSTKHAGQVIGCDFRNAKAIMDDVEVFLFLGGGRFHAIGVELATGRPTIVADPYQKSAYSTHKEVLKLLKRRWASIIEGKKAESFGIIIGLKAGQKRVESAFEIKSRLMERGKRVTLLAAREITPSTLMQFPSLDAYVNTACPRISLDDSKAFRKPVLTLDEAQVMLDNTSWEKLCRKGWFGN